MRENIGLCSDFDMRLLRYQMQAAAKHVLPNHRVGICLRHQIEKYGTVDIWKHRHTQKVFYGGLMVCGSVWVCPVCAAKISERRRAELRQAFDIHRSMGGFCTMMTLTFSHQKSDKLAENLNALADAMKKFREGKAYAGISKEIGLNGTIRAFEITYGQNGWHPHIHLLMMHQLEIEPWELQVIEARYYRLWEAACRKVGLKVSKEHGLRLDDAAKAEEYVGKWGDIMRSKWGVDREMTKANSKRGRAGSMTPFDFLRVIVEDGDLEYESKYKEYSEAVKGKRQLIWSKGLKEKYEIEEQTDEEVAAAKEEPADLLGGLSWQDWRYVVKNDLRATLLNYIESYGYEEAIERIGLKKMKAHRSETNGLIPIGAGI